MINKAEKLAQAIEFTHLDNSATIEEMKAFFDKAKEYPFYSVVVLPHYVKLAKEELKDTDMKVVTVIDFPLGAGNTEGKIFFNVEGGVGEQGPRGYQGYQGYQGAAGKNGTGTQGYQGYKGDSSPNAMTYNNKTTNCNAGLTWTITGATRTYTAFNGGGTITISGTPTQGVEHYLLIHNCGGEDATGVVTFSTSLGILIAKSATIKVPANSYVEVSVVYLQSTTFTGQAKATLVLTCSDVMTKVN
jgi:hypothetical protein